MSRQQSAISNQRTQNWVVLIAGCWLLAAGVSMGCAVFSPIKRLVPLMQPHGSEVLDTGYHDVTGVMHIHTTYSHDAHGTFDDVVRVANAQGLDFVILSEHNTLKPLRDGREGWHGAVLVLIGMEISTRAGHYLALNVQEDIDRFTLTAQQVIDEVNRQGGFGFIAHPYFKHARWSDWTVRGFTGIEGYNVAHDTLEESRFRLVLETLVATREAFYLSMLNRPDEPLRTWDQLIAERGKVVGVGGSDAHEFHLFGVKFAPYEDMFRFSRVHLLVPTLPITDATVYEALRQGHVYFSIELLVPAKGFQFFAEDGQRVLGMMGDEVALAPNMQFTVLVPTPGQMALYKDGRVMATNTGEQWRMPITEVGVYRLEVSRHGKPWIFSNPIYVRPTQTRADSEPSAPARAQGRPGQAADTTQP